MAHMLVPYGGLCNRLRAVLTAYELARHTGQEIRVAWGRDAECAAWFTDLFEPLAAPGFRLTRRPFFARRGQLRDLHLPPLLRRFMGYAPQFRALPPPTEESRAEFLRILQEHPKVYAATCYDYTEIPAATRRLLRPVPHLAATIQRLTSQYAPYTVGVHIRRTDNAASIAHSTDEAFLQAMDAEISAHPEARFFLATDDAPLKAALCRRYAERLLTHQAPTMARSRRDGMESAVIDLFCLAATHKILGSFRSSFTEDAAALGGIPLQIVSTPHNP